MRGEEEAGTFLLTAPLKRHCGLTPTRASVHLGKLCTHVHAHMYTQVQRESECRGQCEIGREKRESVELVERKCDRREKGYRADRANFSLIKCRGRRKREERKESRDVSQGGEAIIRRGVSAVRGEI